MAKSKSTRQPADLSGSHSFGDMSAGVEILKKIALLHKEYREAEERQPAFPSSATPAPTIGQQLHHEERLGVAASYLETSLGRLDVAISALENVAKNSKVPYAEARILEGIRAMLRDDVHNDIDVAREIYQTWNAQEATNG